MSAALFFEGNILNELAQKQSEYLLLTMRFLCSSDDNLMRDLSTSTGRRRCPSRLIFFVSFFWSGFEKND
jgi:hypothetical protein